MSDHLTIEQRHKNMAAVKSKDTKPEMVVRKYLWSRGFRYRVNNPRLPGHPDIVLRKYHTCIFVNGCFWHGHDCSFFKLPASRTDFWQKKIQGNRLRDFRCLQELQNMGWRSLVIWECAIRGKSPSSMKGLVECIGNWLNKGADSMSIDARGSHV